MYSHVNMYTSIVVYLQLLGLVLETHVLETPPTFYFSYGDFGAAKVCVQGTKILTSWPSSLKMLFHANYMQF